MLSLLGTIFFTFGWLTSFASAYFIFECQSLSHKYHAQYSTCSALLFLLLGRVSLLECVVSCMYLEIWAYTFASWAVLPTIEIGMLITKYNLDCPRKSSAFLSLDVQTRSHCCHNCFPRVNRSRAGRGIRPPQSCEEISVSFDIII